MATPQLPFDFTPISIDYVKSAKTTGEVIGYNADLKLLWRILMLGGGWGTAVKQPVLADLLYEAAPTTPHQNETPSANHSRNRKGIIWFENVLKGHTPITVREAEAFHLALGAAFGKEWAERISKERFVMMSVGEFFKQIEIHSLLWPETLHSIDGIKALLEFVPSNGFHISPAFEHASRAGYVPGSYNQGLVSLEDIPAYKEDSKFDLHVDGIANDSGLCCVFELCPDGLRYPEADEVFFILPYAVEKCFGQRMIFDANGKSYRIGKAKGRFEFIALEIKSSESPLLQFFSNGDDSPFNTEKAHAFAAALVSEVFSGSNTCRVAKHSYQVL